MAVFYPTPEVVNVTVTAGAEYTLQANGNIIKILNVYTQNVYFNENPPGTQVTASVFYRANDGSVTYNVPLLNAEHGVGRKYDTVTGSEFVEFHQNTQFLLTPLSYIKIWDETQATPDFINPTSFELVIKNHKSVDISIYIGYIYIYETDIYGDYGKPFIGLFKFTGADHEFTFNLPYNKKMKLLSLICTKSDTGSYTTIDVNGNIYTIANASVGIGLGDGYISYALPNLILDNTVQIKITQCSDVSNIYYYASMINAISIEI